MRKFFPAIGASLMLAANVLTGETGVQVAAQNTADPAGGEYTESGTTPNGEVEVGGSGQTTDPFLYQMNQYDRESGKGIILNDNDLVEPRYERNFTPIER